MTSVVRDPDAMGRREPLDSWRSAVGTRYRAATAMRSVASRARRCAEIAP